jgi:hypothetical protein
MEYGNVNAANSLCLIYTDYENLLKRIRIHVVCARTFA